MKYDKMTKDELIEKLKEQKHLATTIQAKEKELGELRYKITLAKKESIQKENELKRMIERLSKENEFCISQEEFNKTINKLKAEKDRAALVANRYAQAYKDYLKLTQQILNMAITTDELIKPKKNNIGGQ